MAERPEAPGGAGSWLEQGLVALESLGYLQTAAYARAELNELREQVGQAGKCQHCQALLHTRCPDCAGVREPP